MVADLRIHPQFLLTKHISYVVKSLPHMRGCTPHSAAKRA